MSTLNFAKGHGTCNDFVILEDRENLTPITAEVVHWLCDRRAGIGGDGLLRAVRAEFVPELADQGEVWFMDYRNSDGSIAEMCGNGLRVFVRYLLEQGLVDTDPVVVATRAGTRSAWPQPDGTIKVSMGPATVSAEPTWIEHEGAHWPATTVDVGNPHAVVMLDHPASLAALDLGVAPSFDAAVYPNGVNVEFVVVRGADDLLMRVHERGVGETMSCGTGVVASAAAHLASTGRSSGVVSVTVPGGELQVEVDPEQAYLQGAAVIVAHGSVALPGEGVAATG